MSNSSTSVTSLLDGLERAAALPVLDEAGCVFKITLSVGAWDLYVLERLAASVGVARDRLAVELLGSVLLDAVKHSVGRNAIDDMEADDFIYAVEAERALQLNLAAMRRAWRAEQIENRPIWGADGTTATTRAHAVDVAADDERIASLLSKEVGEGHEV